MIKPVRHNRDIETTLRYEHLLRDSEHGAPARVTNGIAAGFL